MCERWRQRPNKTATIGHTVGHTVGRTIGHANVRDKDGRVPSHSTHEHSFLAGTANCHISALRNQRLHHSDMALESNNQMRSRGELLLTLR